jgi:hypothetical protein
VAAMQLTRTHRILIGVVVAGAVMIAGIGFAGSYAAVRDLAERKGFGDFALVFPIGIDAGICVLLALDLLLTWMRIPFPMLRQTAWLLTVATIAFNGAASWPDPLGVGMHAVIPVLFVVTVEAARHAIGRIADITADKHMEGVRLTRWLLSPIPTFKLWRRMKLWELRSYEQVIKLEQERLIYQARLQARYGRAWRRKAPVEALMPLRLARYGVPLAQTAAAGLAAAGVDPVLLPPAARPELEQEPRTATAEAAGREQAASAGPAVSAEAAGASGTAEAATGRTGAAGAGAGAGSATAGAHHGSAGQETGENVSVRPAGAEAAQVGPVPAGPPAAGTPAGPGAPHRPGPGLPAEAGFPQGPDEERELRRKYELYQRQQYEQFRREQEAAAAQDRGSPWFNNHQPPAPYEGGYDPAYPEGSAYRADRIDRAHQVGQEDQAGHGTHHRAGPAPEPVLVPTGPGRTRPLGDPEQREGAVPEPVPAGPDGAGAPGDAAGAAPGVPAPPAAGGPVPEQVPRQAGPQRPVTGPAGATGPAPADSRAAAEGKAAADAGEEGVSEAEELEFYERVYPVFVDYSRELGDYPRADQLAIRLNDMHGITHPRASALIRQAMPLLRKRLQEEMEAEHIA